MLKNIKVIFLGAGPTALAGIREVSREKLDVFAIGLNRFEAGLFSKHCTSLGVCDPFKDSKGLVKLLENFAQKESGKLILIPTGDEFIEFLSQYKEELAYFGYKFSLLNNDLSELFLNKEKFYNLCQQTKTPAPKTWTINQDSSLEKWSQDALYPCFIKPIYYHKWAKVYGLKKGFLVFDKDELLRTYDKVSKNIDELIVQEVIEGADDKIVIYTANFSKNLKPKQIFTGRKKRQYPKGFGTTTAAISEDIKEIKNYAENILSEVGFEGVCDVEFKFDKRDGLYKIIEINPRIGRWYRLVTKSGKKPLTSSILDLAKSEKTLQESEQENGKLWLFPIRDLPSIMKTDAIKDYFKRAKVWCIFELKDPIPFFVYFLEMASKLIKRKNV